MEIILLGVIVMSFVVTLLLTPVWIKRVKKAGLVGKDMNKYEGKDVAEAGGVSFIAGLLMGILSYIAIKTFYFKDSSNLIEIISLISVILIICIVGFIDDVLGWKIGLRQREKPILCLIAAIPLMVINAGDSTMGIPFIGVINFGIFYSLVLIPLGITIAANSFNLLAGYNGLETGQGIIILSTLAFVFRFTGQNWLLIIDLCAIAALLAFLIYNKYPAKIFPGDILTYSVGAFIAGIAILGNVERITILLFIPYLIEFILKASGKLKKESFAKPNKDNSLDLKYKRIYGLEHLAIVILKRIKPSKKVYEKEVVYLIWFGQIILGAILIVLFRYFGLLAMK